MHAYIKRALVFAALVAAGFVLLAAEAPTEQHVALSRDRRAFALGVAYWEITADVATSFMPLPVGR